MTSEPASSKPIRFRSSSPRVSVERFANLVDSQAGPIEAVIVDISSEGFRLKVTKAPTALGRSLLRIDREKDYPVEIKWIRGNQVGGTFLERAPDLA